MNSEITYDIDNLSQIFPVRGERTDSTVRDIQKVKTRTELALLSFPEFPVQTWIFNIRSIKSVRKNPKKNGTARVYGDILIIKYLEDTGTLLPGEIKENHRLDNICKADGVLIHNPFAIVDKSSVLEKNQIEIYQRIPRSFDNENDYAFAGLDRRQVGNDENEKWWFVKVYYIPNDSFYEMPAKNWERGDRPTKETWRESKVLRVAKQSTKHTVLSAYQDSGGRWCVNLLHIDIPLYESSVNILRLRDKGKDGFRNKYTKSDIVTNSNEYHKDYRCVDAIYHPEKRGIWKVKMRHKLTGIEKDFVYSQLVKKDRKQIILPVEFNEVVTSDKDYSFVFVVEIGKKGQDWFILFWDKFYQREYLVTYRSFRNGTRSGRNTRSKSKIKRLREGVVRDKGFSIVAIMIIEIEGAKFYKIGKTTYRYNSVLKSLVKRYNYTGDSKEKTKVLKIVWATVLETELASLLFEDYLLSKTVRYTDYSVPESWDGSSEVRTLEGINKAFNVIKDIYRGKAYDLTLK